MDTLSLVSKYSKALEECMDDGDSRVAKEMKLFDALEHKSVVIEVGNQKFAIFTKAPLWAFGEPFMRSFAKLDLADSTNYVMEKVLDGMGFVHVSIGDYSRKMVNDVNLESHEKKFHRLLPFHYNQFTTPLTSKQREKMKEVLDIRYKELEESKPILEVLENYVICKRKLDEILMVDTGASVSVLTYSLYKALGLVDLRPYQTNLTMADNTQAKAMGEVINVRIQIGYQAYVVDLLVLDILVDPQLPLLLGGPFLRTCSDIIDMGRGTLCIDDRVILHTYFPKPRSKSYVETFEMEGEDDWLGNFQVGRDEDGNAKYGLVAPSFLDIEDDMERALAMEAYFNPFKNIIVFKKLVDFLGSLPVQLKNIDWGNEGSGTYKKIDDNGNWHARFEIVTPSERKFDRAFKTKTTTKKLSGKFTTEDVLRFSHFLE
nr:hypothetical protein [Tanacetum cinerariifolium]